jgi:molybdate transport system substrate-binding protein
MRSFLFAAASAALLTVGPIASTKAAELNVLAGGSMTDSLREIAPRFERATGHKLVFLFAGTPELIRQATSGAPFMACSCGRDVPTLKRPKTDGREEGHIRL